MGRKRLTEAQLKEAFIHFMGGPSTGDDLADLIRRITPEDGAEWVWYNDEGLAMKWSPIRADWEDICLKAAAHMRAILPEMRERMKRTMPNTPWRNETVMEAALKEVLVFRKQLLSNNGDENDG